MCFYCIHAKNKCLRWYLHLEVNNRNSHICQIICILKTIFNICIIVRFELDILQESMKNTLYWVEPRCFRKKIVLSSSRHWQWHKLACVITGKSRKQSWGFSRKRLRRSSKIQIEEYKFFVVKSVDSVSLHEWKMEYL